MLLRCAFPNEVSMAEKRHGYFVKLVRGWSRGSLRSRDGSVLLHQVEALFMVEQSILLSNGIIGAHSCGLGCSCLRSSDAGLRVHSPTRLGIINALRLAGSGFMSECLPDAKVECHDSPMAGRRNPGVAIKFMENAAHIPSE